MLAFFLANDDGISQTQQSAVLLHDAAEAYVGDCVKPLKNMLPEFEEIETRLQIVIGEKYGIDFRAHEEVTKKYDYILLKAEKKKLLPDDHEEWDGLDAVEDRFVGFNCFRPDDAKGVFLRACKRQGLLDESMLQACPICGGVADITEPVSGVFNIGCGREVTEGCGLVLFGSSDDTRTDMINKWNNRI